MADLSKRERQIALSELLESEPFLTDEELSQRFGVSIQTIRLDRLSMGIPELRERIKTVAKSNQASLQSLEGNEVIGELIELAINEMAISLLDIESEHVFSKTHIARGHHLFAQANSLAVATIGEDVVLTKSASIRFVRSVRLGERLICKATVRENQADRAYVDVQTKVGEDIVFEGKFTVIKWRSEVERRNIEIENSH